MKEIINHGDPTNNISVAINNLDLDEPSFIFRVASFSTAFTTSEDMSNEVTTRSVITKMEADLEKADFAMLS